MATAGGGHESEQAIEGGGQGRDISWSTQGDRSCPEDEIDCGNRLTESSQVWEKMERSVSSSLQPDADAMVCPPPRPGPGRPNLMGSMRRAVLVDACVSNEVQVCLFVY